MVFEKDLNPEKGVEDDLPPLEEDKPNYLLYAGIAIVALIAVAFLFFRFVYKPQPKAMPQPVEADTASQPKQMLQ